MQSFQVGNTYTSRSIGDHDCIIAVTILKRTAKTVSAKALGNVKNFRIFEYDGAECIRPWGSYSMSPVIRAA